MFSTKSLYRVITDRGVASKVSTGLSLIELTSYIRKAKFFRTLIFCFKFSIINYIRLAKVLLKET